MLDARSEPGLAPRPRPRPGTGPAVAGPEVAGRRSDLVRPLARPAPSSLLDTDIVLGALGFLAIVVGIWVRHGGLTQMTDWTGAATGLAQITGLLASAAGLLGVALAARPRRVDRRFGLDRMLVWHRILGETMAVLVGFHVAFGVAEWSTGKGGVFGAIRDLTGRSPYMAGAAVGAALVGVVTVSSLRSLRRQLSYETWYLLHLTAYLGLALSFSHEIVVGGDLSGDTVARWFWVAAHVAVLTMLAAGRWGRLVRAFLRPLRVTGVQRHGDGTVAMTLGGPGLAGVRADAGQFMMLRPVRSRLWWQAHPFSLSAAPSTAGLRFTIKDRGDASAAISDLSIGTRVAIEGPYGATTPDVIAGRKVLFVAGGVGIAPVRAMLERLDPSAAPVVLYRAHREADLVHLDELRALAARCGGTVHTLVGPTLSLAVKDPFSAPVLAKIVPDVAERVAVLCGPERLLDAARKGLRAAGVAARDIHYERVWW